MRRNVLNVYYLADRFRQCQEIFDGDVLNGEQFSFPMISLSEQMDVPW